MEKLATGFWAPAFSAARCIVPMRGYFEWTGEKGDKTPRFLHGDGLLSATGLTWSMKLPNGERSRCFVVITREARDASGEVHGRMPAFLTPDTWDAWLTLEKLTGERKIETLAMLDHTSTDVAATITEHIVDRKVNNSRTANATDRSLIEPAAQAGLMLIGLIRPIETHTNTPKGEDLADVRAQLVAQAPQGWELVSAVPKMTNGTPVRSVEGKFERRDGEREIEAEDMPALEAQVPEGWQMLSVRTN